MAPRNHDRHGLSDVNPVLGTAPDSWGVWFADDPRQSPWNRFLDEVAEVGYRWIELGPYGYLPTDPQVLERELAGRGLAIAAGNVTMPLEDPAASNRARTELEQVCRLLRSLGARYLVLIDDVYRDLVTGDAVAPALLDEIAWRCLVDTTHRVAETASLHDLQLVFHPHVETHVEHEEQIERFLEDIDSQVGLCLDLGHHAYWGGDPVEFFRRHQDRIAYLHLKSVEARLRMRVRERAMPFAQAVALGVFVEPAQGVIDFLALRDALREAGYEGFAIVEQDMYPTRPEKPLPIAKRTRQYLQHIGLA